MTQKDIVFYSNMCSYSNEVINLIKETNLEKTLMLINIDDDDIKLPDFIKVVPTVYLINEKSLIIDSSILEWIKKKTTENSSNIDLNGYNNNFFSESFSDLQDTNLENNNDYFSSINEDIHINYSQDSEKKQKINYNDIQQQRSEDLKNLYN